MQEHASLSLHELKQAAFQQLKALSQPAAAAHVSNEELRAAFVEHLLLLLVSTRSTALIDKLAEVLSVKVIRIASVLSCKERNSSR